MRLVQFSDIKQSRLFQRRKVTASSFYFNQYLWTKTEESSLALCPKLVPLGKRSFVKNENLIYSLSQSDTRIVFQHFLTKESLSCYLFQRRKNYANNLKKFMRQCSTSKVSIRK